MCPLISSNHTANMTKLRYRCIRLSLCFSSNQEASMKKAVNKTIVLAWLTMSREKKSLPFIDLALHGQVGNGVSHDNVKKV